MNDVLQCFYHFLLMTEKLNIMMLYIHFVIKIQIHIHVNGSL